MDTKKRILLKLTGEAFLSSDRKGLSSDIINAIIRQIAQLQSTHLFSVVVGGGNFFRGSCEGKLLGITASAAHQAGMLATLLNGIILKDLFTLQTINSTLLCAIDCPTAGTLISLQAIEHALAKEQVIIFTGGTGNPFFTTDTNAVLRALQINAHQIWKGTKVDGVYNKDPHQNNDAQLLQQISYHDALQNNLQIMDTTALTLAQQHKQLIRVFNIFEDNSLVKAAHDNNFGSTLSCHS